MSLSYKDVVEREQEISSIEGLFDIVNYSVERMFDLYNEFIKEVEKSGAVLDQAEAYPSLLYHRNCYYLAGVHQLLKQGLRNPSHSLLRTVQESIWIMYFTNFGDPKESEEYHKLKLGEFANLYDIDELKVKFPEVDWEIKRKYSYSKICDRLYSKKLKKNFYTLYSQLSDGVHASLTGIGRDSIFKIDDIVDVYHHYLRILMNNIACFYEIYQDTFLIDELDHIIELFDRIAEFLSYQVYWFTPDERKIKSQFKSVEEKMKEKL